MASVDGAVIIDWDFTVSGFGAEILPRPIDDDNEMVEHGTHPFGKPPDRPLYKYGMRHRSAYRLCKAVNNSLAFVISQDGDIRVFCHVDGKVKLFIESIPDPWIFNRFVIAPGDEKPAGQESTET